MLEKAKQKRSVLRNFMKRESVKEEEPKGQDEEE